MHWIATAASLSLEHLTQVVPFLSYSRWQKSCNKQDEQWKTTIDLPCMNLIVLPKPFQTQ